MLGSKTMRQGAPWSSAMIESKELTMRYSLYYLLLSTTYYYVLMPKVEIDDLDLFLSLSRAIRSLVSIFFQRCIGAGEMTETYLHSSSFPVITIKGTDLTRWFLEEIDLYNAKELIQPNGQNPQVFWRALENTLVAARLRVGGVPAPLDEVVQAIEAESYRNHRYLVRAADRLNARGYSTRTGLRWTSERLRTYVRRDVRRALRGELIRTLDRIGEQQGTALVGTLAALQQEREHWASGVKSFNSSRQPLADLRRHR